ncbi:hypothetical protein D3C81_1841980 [compost metagenome]
MSRCRTAGKGSSVRAAASRKHRAKAVGEKGPSTLSTELRSAAPRQKLSCRLMFHRALAWPMCEARVSRKARVCAVLLHRLLPSPIRA